MSCSPASRGRQCPSYQPIGLSAYSASNALAAAEQTTFDSSLARYRSRVGSITDVYVAQAQLLQTFSAAATLALATGALGSGSKIETRDASSRRHFKIE
jgi:hypothetical protein